MNVKIYLLTLIISVSCSNKIKKSSKNSTADIKRILEEHEQTLAKKNKVKNIPAKITNYSTPKLVTPPPIFVKTEPPPLIVSPASLKLWAEDISQTIFEIDRKIVRREELLKSFSDAKMEIRDGSQIVERTAKSLEDLLLRRTRAAEEIMRKAEEIATPTEQPPPGYTFESSLNLDETKQMWDTVEMENGETLPNCTSVQRVKLQPSVHFDTPISLEKSSVHVAIEEFPCNPKVLPHLAWSEGLLTTFQKNFAQDSTIGFQYFCSAKGFLRHYPASLWSSNFKQGFIEENDVYDCRLRPWYVSSEGAPRDVLILFDASGSMNESVNQYVGEVFTANMLSALTDDDQVNVLRFNVELESPISCFNDKLVSANHINSAAMISALKDYYLHNETFMSEILEHAVRLLQRQHGTHDRPPSCQQAIVLLTDSMEQNHTALMRRLDPFGRIRFFTLWLHDPNGLRDGTRGFADHVSCDRDGYFAELITHADVTQQVMRILQILERPLVAQRKERLRVFSDVFAHVEDPRRGEQQWRDKESEEQAFRYESLRKDKKKLLSRQQRYKDYMYHESLDKLGYYYEGEDVNYRLQISVAVPVFESTTIENITITLDEERERNSTRTYPVNRLLGVVGIDIPLDDLKLLLPYHQVGGGGSLFLIDHRGNIVLHDNIKPMFDGDILKPGYRTVDFIDLEQPASDHPPRHYPEDWLKFRKSLIIDYEKGNMTMYGKNIFEYGLRVQLEMREYHWKRVLDHYTAVVVLPPYGRHHIAPETTFTKQMAERALKALLGTDFAVHPDWLYCRHIEPHFDNREAEVLHFIRRRSDESNFPMKKIEYNFSPIPPTLLEKSYQCDEGLMAKLCKEAIATEKWAREHEEPHTDRDCSTCELGSTTAFFTSESGLTRWQHYHATSQHAAPPSGAAWSYGPSESWYRRAVARPGTLIIHAPVSPVRRLRASFKRPPSLGVNGEWLTAASTLSSDKGLIGVAGFHFYPQHLVELLTSVTEMPCYLENKSQCKPRCEGMWTCVLIDEGGWVVARRSNDTPELEDAREHLSIVHPHAMAAMKRAGIFQLNWVHDYQGVCFPPFNAAPMLPTLLKSLWHAVKAVFQISTQLFTLVTLTLSTTGASSETAKEKAKRKNHLKSQIARDEFDSLYNESVLINKTVFAACDRTRPVYLLQHNQRTIDLLSRPPTPAELEDCSWPMVGAFVPKTNLLLLAIHDCEDTPYTGKPLANPLINLQYMEDYMPVTGVQMSPASKLACWRNKVPLPGRQPTTACYQHNYTNEIGYRQCGPWLPDREPENSANVHYISQLVTVIALVVMFT